ncbi:unnamed protein product [Mytilus coruscus]|uniref:Uncharacterized protein n=1 Tax=Mytilus coruscus TaxID=42192 RepID=A0A6J8CN56_MYTCO|nr:unnamed protein product [Mytilus coruscus]
MQYNQEEMIMFKIWIYGLTLFVLASTTTSNSAEDVEVRLLDNQNAPLVATLDMSKANERVKQFVSDAIEAKMKNIEETVKSKQYASDALEDKLKNIEETVKSKKFVSDALRAIMRDHEINLKSQIANFERNLTDQLTDYIDNKVGKKDEEKEKPEELKQRPFDCEDVKTKKENGIYKIYPYNLI